MAARTAHSAGLRSVVLGMGLFLLVSVTLGCASASSQGGAGTPSATATPSPLPAIAVQRTGGFAGRQDSVTLDPNGTWTATDRAGKQKTGTLTAGQLAQIRTLAADPRLAAEAGQTRQPTRCRDAFAYKLTVGATHTAFADCPSDPDQPAAAIALAKAVVGSTIAAPSPAQPS